MGNQTYIEINGKKYDTLTGKLIHDKPSAPVQKTTFQPSVGVVDGFTRRPKQHVSREGSAHHSLKTPQKSHTLARSAVKKPQPASKVASQPIAPVTKPTLKTPEQRTQRALTTSQSPTIHKYPAAKSNHIPIAKQGVVPTQTLPKAAAAPHTPQTTNHRVNTTKQQAHKETLITNALQAAHGHESLPHHGHTHHKKHRITKKFGISRKVATLSTSVLAFVLLAGFFAVQNVPNLSMRVASTRAGFTAEMPDYKPAGFSFKGPIRYQAGQVTATFKSNIDERQYTLTQSSSNWNSDALLANYVAADNKQYQTYLDKGRTLYIYDNSNASWVDNGVWYQIEGESSLTTDQLIRIASSL